MRRKQSKGQRKALIVAVSAAILSVSVLGGAATHGETVKMSSEGTIRAVPIGKKLRPIFEDVFGESYARRVAYAVDMPKGLLRGRVLHYPPGTVQTILVTGKLTDYEINSLQIKLTERLGADLEAGESYASLVLKVFDQPRPEGKDTRIPTYQSVITFGQLMGGHMTGGQASE